MKCLARKRVILCTYAFFWSIHHVLDRREARISPLKGPQFGQMRPPKRLATSLLNSSCNLQRKLDTIRAFALDRVCWGSGGDDSPVDSRADRVPPLEILERLSGGRVTTPKHFLNPGHGYGRDCLNLFLGCLVREVLHPCGANVCGHEILENLFETAFEEAVRHLCRKIGGNWRVE